MRRTVLRALRPAAQLSTWALGAATTAAMLCSGCLTVGMWGRVSAGSPASRVKGMTGDPGREILVAARQCPDRPDGVYSMTVPDDWATRPTTASRWGSEIRALAAPLEFAKVDGGAKSGGGMARLTFRALAIGRPPDSGLEYGVLQHRTAEDRLAAEFFGYSRARRGWVHLGGVTLDRYRPRAGAVVAATVATPLTASLDISAFILAIYLSNGNCAPVLYCEPRPQSAVRRDLIAGLGQGDPARRAGAAVALRWMAMEAKAAVPALRRMLQDPDPRARLEAAHTLVLICPRDAEQDGHPIVDLLANGDAPARRLAASKAGILPAGMGVPALMGALQDTDADVRAQAATIMAMVAPDSADVLAELDEATRDDAPQVRKAAAAALREITRTRERRRVPRGTERPIVWTEEASH